MYGRQLVLSLSILLLQCVLHETEAVDLSRGFLDGSSTCGHPIYTETVPGYEWFTTGAVRQKAQVYAGDRARLRAAMYRFQTSQQLNVVFLGGSITAGQGAEDGHPFPTWAELALQSVMGKGVHVHNGAVPGTLSSYMSVCHNVHVPKDADIIILDYTINDESNPMPILDNYVRRPFERLLRKLLNYPRRPAVVLIHSFIWHRLPELGPSGLYFTSSEREFHEFAMFYGLPELSVKAAAWRLMLKGKVTSEHPTHLEISSANEC